MKSLNLRKLIIIVVLPGIATAVLRARATETDVALRQAVAFGVPLKLTGRIKVLRDALGSIPTKVVLDVTSLNVSEKPILLSVTSVDVSTSSVRLSHTEEDDFFFEASLLQPGSNAHWHVTVPIGHSSSTVENLPYTSAKATAEVLFIEFGDGSTWGKSERATRVLYNRRLALKRLTQLSQVYASGDRIEFVNLLSKTTSLQPLLALQNDYEVHRNVQKVYRDLQEMLRSAEAHSNAVLEPH